MKRRIALFLLVLMAALALAPVSGAMAETPKLKMETHTYWAKTPSWYTVFTENLPDDAKLVSAKSSKPNVLSIEKWGSDKWDVVVHPEKPGKSVVTVVYKFGGKRHAVKGTFTVKKYPNAIKSLTLNKKAINLKKNPFEADCTNNKNSKITIKVTAAKGWKVVNPIEILSEGCSYKTVKNGRSVKISLKKERVAALITLINGAGEEFNYYINLTE